MSIKQLCSHCASHFYTAISFLTAASVHARGLQSKVMSGKTFLYGLKEFSDDLLQSRGERLYFLKCSLTLISHN